MRGKANPDSPGAQAYRITPAYAGKRGKGWQAGNSTQDHPRLCGEKLDVDQREKVLVGSPPPMRGKVRYGSCANGTTRDHPRLCGEKP